MGKSISPDPPEETVELPKVEPETVPKVDAITARTLSFAHESGYIEGYGDALRLAFLFMAGAAFCLAIASRCYYNESE